MARHVRDAGHELVVWNRTPGKAGDLVDAGAVEAHSVREAAEGADAIVLILSGPPSVREVLPALVEGAPPGPSSSTRRRSRRRTRTSSRAPARACVTSTRRSPARCRPRRRGPSACSPAPPRRIGRRPCRSQVCRCVLEVGRLLRPGHPPPRRRRRPADRAGHGRIGSSAVSRSKYVELVSKKTRRQRPRGVAMTDCVTDPFDRECRAAGARCSRAWRWTRLPLTARARRSRGVLTRVLTEPSAPHRVRRYETHEAADQDPPPERVRTPRHG